ncbi:MAG TPA: TraR/DksA family transcriptional regulator [Polyangiaceae bacterium]|nr:TraR/DksA family transcriptional regulator [Polyangiaceae bacterium]
MSPKSKASSSELTPERLAMLRRALEEKRTDLLRKLGAANIVEEPETDPTDAADQERLAADTLGLAEQQRELVEEVDAALDRMKQGSYGISEISGRPIPFRRLEAVPWARSDVNEEEKRDRP